MQTIYLQTHGQSDRKHRSYMLHIETSYSRAAVWYVVFLSQECVVLELLPPMSLPGSMLSTWLPNILYFEEALLFRPHVWLVSLWGFLLSFVDIWLKPHPRGRTIYKEERSQMEILSAPPRWKSLPLPTCHNMKQIQHMVARTLTLQHLYLAHVFQIFLLRNSGVSQSSSVQQLLWYLKIQNHLLIMKDVARFNQQKVNKMLKLEVEIK